MINWNVLAICVGIIVAIACLVLALFQVSTAFDQSMDCSDDEVET